MHWASLSFLLACIWQIRVLLFQRAEPLFLPKVAFRCSSGLVGRILQYLLNCKLNVSIRTEIKLVYYSHDTNHFDPRSIWVIWVLISKGRKCFPWIKCSGFPFRFPSFFLPLNVVQLRSWKTLKQFKPSRWFKAEVKSRYVGLTLGPVNTWHAKYYTAEGLGGFPPCTFDRRPHLRNTSRWKILYVLLCLWLSGENERPDFYLQASYCAKINIKVAFLLASMM